MTEPDPIAPAPDAAAAPNAAAPAATDADRARRASPWLRLLLVALALATLLLVAHRLGGYVAIAATRIRGLGVWAPLAFVAAYAVATVALLPGSALTLAGGALFGLLRGTVYVFAGATLGASAAFLIARHLARGVVEGRLAANPRFAAIDRAIAREGRKIVFLLRLSPVFPFNLLNYALGLTRVRFVDYLLASLGMLPGTVLYVYTGKALGDVVAVAAGAAVPHDARYWGVLALGLAATATVTIVVTRTARRALAEEVKDVPS